MTFAMWTHPSAFQSCHPLWNARPKLVVAMATSNRETNTRLNIYTNMSTNSENLVKIGLVVSEISLLQAIVKKEKKKKVTEAKHKPCRLKSGELINIRAKHASWCVSCLKMSSSTVLHNDFTVVVSCDKRKIDTTVSRGLFCGSEYLQGGPKIWHHYSVRLNCIKY